MKKQKKTKKPVYAPYERTYGQEGYYLPEDMCPGEEPEIYDLEHMSLPELENLCRETEGAISDWEIMIDSQLQDIRMGHIIHPEDLASDRRHKQQLVVELRAIKKQIRKMKMVAITENEVPVA